MLFKEIFALDQVKSELIKSVENNRIAHSQLFIGQKGSPKLSLAIAYARFINCLNPINQDSCESCTSCLKYTSLSHPDLHIIFPVIKTSKCTRSSSYLKSFREFYLKNPYCSLEDWFVEMGEKKPHIYTHEFTSTKECLDSSRETLYNKLALKNFESRFRVVIVWGPENMMKLATNKLLKVLEEPPKGTIVILVSEEEKKLLPTVLSRLQLTNIPSYNDLELSDFYQNTYGDDKNNLSLKASGDISFLIRMQSSNDEGFLLAEFSKWMRLCFKQDFVEITKWANGFSKKSLLIQKKLLLFAIKVIRNSIIYNFSNHSILKISNDEKVFISKFSAFINEENSILIVNEFEKSISYLNRNISAKILLFELSIQVTKLLKVKAKFVQN